MGDLGDCNRVREEGQHRGVGTIPHLCDMLEEEEEAAVGEGEDVIMLTTLKGEYSPGYRAALLPKKAETPRWNIADRLRRRQEREDNPFSIWPPSPKHPFVDEE